jgi:hypothetical protein
MASLSFIVAIKSSVGADCEHVELDAFTGRRSQHGDVGPSLFFPGRRACALQRTQNA